jgi:hypothetical protein
MLFEAIRSDFRSHSPAGFVLSDGDDHDSTEVPGVAFDLSFHLEEGYG